MLSFYKFFRTVVEFADGIFQRETKMLLKNPEVRNRISKLIYCAHDATGVIGGLKVFKEEFQLMPDAISGYCSSSPLALREFSNYTDIPSFDSMSTKLDEILPIIV